MVTLRRVAELLARNRRVVRRTPARFDRRPIVVSPDASLRWLRPDPWRDEDDLMFAIATLATPGKRCWDFGANVGAFALCAAAASGRPVLAVEADAFLVELLHATAARNPDLRLEVLSCAVGPAAGVAAFAIAGRGRATNGLVEGAISTQHGISRAVRHVPTLPADLLLDAFDQPDVVKIDLEGAERLFIAGATRLIEEVRPAFYIEVHRDNRPAVLGHFRDNGYAIRQRFDGRWIEWRDEPFSEDFYVLPSERADLFDQNP